MRQKLIGFWDCSGVSWIICKQSAPHSQTDNRANTSSLKVTAHKQSAFQGNPKTASKQLGQLVVRHVRCVVVLMSVVVVILSALNKE